MDWDPKDRDRFLRNLDEAKRKVQLIYAITLIGGAVLLLSFLAYAFWKWDGPGPDPLSLFLGGIFLLGFLIWVFGQLRGIYLDMPPPPGKLVPGDFNQTPGDVLNIESHNEPGRHEFKLSFGSAPPDAETHGASFTTPLASGSIATTELADETALTMAEALMGEGFDLERTCRYVNPRFATWNAVQQDAYAVYLKAKLDERKLKN